jgi:hypothetical protein
MLSHLIGRAGLLMDEAGDGTGMGDASAAAGSAPEAPAARKVGSEDGESASHDAEKGSKPTDAEAKLLREVMEKKAKLKESGEQLAQVKAQLARFDGIDPEAIRTMLAEQKAAQEKQLEAKGQWDALKKQMNDQHAVELRAREEVASAARSEAETLRGQIAELTVGNEFAKSRFIADELALTPSKTRVVYGSHFEFDGERVVGYDKPQGQKGRTQLVDARGEPLGFEQAMRKLIEADPDRDQLLKAKGRTGAGSVTEGRAPAPKAERDVSSTDKIRAGLGKLTGAK